MNLLYGTSSFIPLLLFLCFLYLTVPGCIWPVTSTIQHSLLWFLLSTINQAVKLILPLDLHRIINLVSNSGHLYRISKDLKFFFESTCGKKPDHSVICVPTM